MTFQWNWLHGEFDDPLEVSSFAALKVVLNGEPLTRVYDQIAGGERDSINVVLYPLALSIAENWWTLLHEPRKSDEDDSSAEIRHSLDSYMNGFVFPALTLWSGGNDAIIVEHPNRRQEHSRLEFLPTASAISVLQRDEVEQNLFELVHAVLARMPHRAARIAQEAWDRVLSSLRNVEERQYCEAAGRLGVDPYDPSSANISDFAEGLSENLFANICEAATSAEIPEASEWAREGARRLQKFPEIDIEHFGKMPDRGLHKIWEHGYEAARLVRRNLNLEDLNPRRVVDQIFGAAVGAEGPTLAGSHPFALEAITQRQNGAMRVAIPSTSARLRRSSLCRASYLAWKTAVGDYSAVTTATTLDQQASRAFAAELLAPAELLREWAGQDGLTPEKVVSFANENVCPEQAIIWQAHNHGIPLRGVALPRSERG